MRAARAEVTTPKFDEAMFVETSWNCVWLRALNDSNRNCSRTWCPISKFLNKARSRLFDAGPALGVTSQISELTQRWLRERGGVEPLVHGSVSDIWVADEIHAVRSERVVQPAEIGGRDRDREAVLPGIDPVQLPPANQRFLHASCVTRDLSALSER